MDTVVSVTDIKTHLSDVLERADSGDRVIIRRRGKPPLALIRLDAPEDTRVSRRKKSSPARPAMAQRLERASQQLGQRFRLSPRQQRRLETLGRKNKQGKLTEAECTELLQLLHRIEALSRQRAQALSERL